MDLIGSDVVTSYSRRYILHILEEIRETVPVSYRELLGLCSTSCKVLYAKLSPLA